MTTDSVSIDGAAADGAAAAERVARASYGRLVAWLAAGSRDIAAAEDALADALCAALESWPARGIPDRPEAWLRTAARRRLHDGRRHGRVHAAYDAAARALGDAAADDEPDEIPDRRLALLFACAHPAIDAAARAPLMLQVIFGLDAARIAAAFLAAPAAMGQRLVRAKAKIRDSGIAFAVPGADELGPRLEAVLEAIYGAYGSAWDAPGGEPTDLCGEAVWLAGLASALLPDEPEAAGLYALLLYCEARRPARRTEAGIFVPLSGQDPARWSMPMIAAAERTLHAAGNAGRPGRFQLEAAIQSAHVGRLTAGQPGWDEIALLYSGLLARAPTAGARVGHAAAVAECDGPDAGLALLDAAPDLAGYQPVWALRAHLLARRGDTAAAAAAAYARAAAMTADPAVRAYLHSLARS
jgi:RNA polymerase sigma-70 factor (ECF subfamily)